jgi:acetyltransferase-like isoleucine patch superfamily enzyme
MDIKTLIFKLLAPIARRTLNFSSRVLLKAPKWGHRGCHTQVGAPAIVANPAMVSLHDYARIQPNSVILTNKGRFVMGKYSIASFNLVAVPDGHRSTVGIPQCLLGASHVHDTVEDIIVDEDVWIGASVVLLGGAHLQRGSIVGANSLINKRTLVPPYAVMAGNPAKIVAVKFSIEQILRHEEKLYPAKDRLSREYLEQLFAEHYADKHVFGTDAPLTPAEQQQLDAVIRYFDFHFPTE